MIKKKAYLVEFSIMTRVVVDDTEKEEEMIDKAIDKAIFKVKNNVVYYIDGDNVMEVREDKECPWTPEEE